MNRSNPRERLRHFLFCMVPSIVILALQNGAAIFGSQVYVVWMLLNAHGNVTQDFGQRFSEGLTSAGFLMGISLIYAVIGVLIFALWYRAMKRQDANTFLNDGTARAADRDSLKQYPVLLYIGIVLFAFAAQYVCEYLVVVLSKMEPEWLAWYEELMQSLDLSGGGVDALVIAYTVFFGPLCEELCFRGLTFNLCRRVMSPFAANVVQALLFGGMHANPLQSVYAFAFGFLLGQIYIDTDNLMITILTHIAFNGLGMCLEQYIMVGSTPMTFFCILFISLLASYLGYLLILKAQQIKNERLEQSDAFKH